MEAYCPGCPLGTWYIGTPNSFGMSPYSVVEKTPPAAACPGVMGVKGGAEAVAPLSEIVGDMVMPPIDDVNGTNEASDGWRECVPEDTGDTPGDAENWSSPLIGVIPNAEAARLVGRERRKLPPPWLVVERVRATGRRGEGDVPW